MEGRKIVETLTEIKSKISPGKEKYHSALEAALGALAETTWTNISDSEYFPKWQCMKCGYKTTLTLRELRYCPYCGKKSNGKSFEG